jgi:hypothetical protein
VAARRSRAVAYQTAEKQRPLGCCFLALRLAAFAGFFASRPFDAIAAGGGLVHGVFTPPLGAFDWGINLVLRVSHGV